MTKREKRIFIIETRSCLEEVANAGFATVLAASIVIAAVAIATIVIVCYRTVERNMGKINPESLAADLDQYGNMKTVLVEMTNKKKKLEETP